MRKPADVRGTHPPGCGTVPEMPRSAIRMLLPRPRPTATSWLTFALVWSLTVASGTSGDEPPGAVAMPPARGEDAALPTDGYFRQAGRRGDDAARAAAAAGRRILREYADDALVLDALAWGILTDDTLIHRDLPLALDAARAAYELTGGHDRDVAETYARGLFLLGRRDEAIAMQRRAVELSVDDPTTRLILEEILDSFLTPPRDPGPTDDDRIRSIEEAALALVEQGRAVPVATLLEGAGVQPCGLVAAPPAAEPLAAEALYEKVRPSVVVVAALEPDLETGAFEVSLASGFVVEASGVVVTNFHVVDVPESPVLVAMTADGRVHPVTRIIAASPFADIAVCRLDGVDDLPALACVTDARPGARLHAVSHPDGAFWSITDGILSRFFSLREDGQARTMFSTTADFAVGSSGGPVVDDRGNVVGMVSSTLAIYASDPATRRAAGGTRRPSRHRHRFALRGDRIAASMAGNDQPAGDFQMGLNLCVPAADILGLLGPRPADR